MMASVLPSECDDYCAVRSRKTHRNGPTKADQQIEKTMRLDIESPAQSIPSSTEILHSNGASPSEKAQVLLDNGIAAAQKGDRRSARLLLDLAVEAEPHLVDGWMWLASISEYPEELLSYLDKILEIDPQNQKAIDWQISTRSLMAKTLVQKAVETDRNGEREGAVSLLDQALEYDEKCIVAWSWKATLEEDNDKKIELLSKVIEIDPENSEAAAAIESINKEKIHRKRSEAGQALINGSAEEALGLFEELSEIEEYRFESLLVAGFFAESLESKLEAFRSAASMAGEDSMSALAVNFLERLSNPETEPFAVAEVPAAIEPAAEAAKIAAEEFKEEPAEDFDTDPPVETAEFETGEPETTLEFDPYSTIAPSDSTEHHFDESGEEVSAHQVDTKETHEYRAEQIFIQAGEEEIFGAAPSEKAASVSECCIYCDSNIDHGSFQCSSCGSALTLADLEMLLSPRLIDKDAVSNAVIAMEAEWNLRELTVKELVGLGIGHFNLGNFDEGLKYLEQASNIDANDVILAGQINAIAIRLEELRRQNELHGSSPRGKTILVIDDSATIRKLISAKLEKSGHAVVTAEDGVEGLEKIAEKTPDLVLLDITMPKMDGYEVCKEIRANPETKDIPVVMISGKDGFFDKVRGRMAGATGYVTKPFGPETLMKALDTYLIADDSVVN